MKIHKVTSIYSAVIGISMIGLWIMLLSTNQVPELATEPYRILAHILAEILTAALLIISAYGLLRRKSWSQQMHPFSQGALLYTLIASPGYYLQTGDLPMVIMFSIILVMNIAFLLLALTRPKELFVTAT